MPGIIEDLDEDEACLYAIISDPSGLDLAEFCWVDYETDDNSLCWRAWPFQWKWFRTVQPLQIDQCGRSVGKSLSIKMRAFCFPFLHSGQEMVITAPELNHLTPIISLVEGLFRTTRLGREMLPKGKNNGITHRPFQADFLNGSRILGRIPQRDGRGIKGTHPLWLEMDEAQDYPDAGWVEIIETLKRGVPGAVWRAHGVTRGVRDYFFKFTQENSGWHVNRYTALHRPTWSDQERQEKIEQYGSKENPDYRRNVLGLHGDAQNALFVLSRLMQCVDTDQSSEYNQDIYTHLRINAEMVDDSNGDISYYLQFPEIHKRNWKVFWAGMDVGYTQHPSEILVFGEERAKKDASPALRLLTRINLQRIHHIDQVKVVQAVMDFYGCAAFSMDKTGVGLPLFQQMQHDNPKLAEQIKGYNFSGKLVVDIDQSIELDEFRGDAVEDAGINKNVLEYSSDKLRELVDQKLLWLPWDTEIIGEFQGQTYVVIKNPMDTTGKKSYSKGNFHALDAAKMAVLGFVQTPMEAYLKGLNNRGAVLDMFIPGEGSVVNLQPFEGTLAPGGVVIL